VIKCFQTYSGPPGVVRSINWQPRSVVLGVFCSPWERISDGGERHAQRRAISGLPGRWHGVEVWGVMDEVDLWDTNGVELGGESGRREAGI